ncbi:MAG: hypothetical protein WCA77_01380 [Thermoplasmata archaeon]
MNALRVHAVILAILVIVSALAVVLLTSPNSSAGNVVSSTSGVIPLTFSTRNSYSLAPGFWGTNVRAYSALGPTQKAEWDATPLSYVLWPGGRAGDAYDYLNNVIYSDNGAAFSPPTDVAQFASWCKSVGCIAIMQLPGEIDSASYAAKEANYIVNTLHFQPAYWEIGNEPTQWKHFGDAWSTWNLKQHTNATPMGYADLVRSYIAAVKAVDPGAKFLGLPGVGTGAFDEQTWITATVRVNGPDLAGIAIHVYPAGGYGVSHGSDGQFFTSLTSKGALPERVPLDEQAIREACPSCKIGIFATELNSGNQGAGYNDQIDGFPEVTFLTAEVIQGMKLDLANIDMYAFEASYGGALFTSSSSPTRVDTLYSTIFSQLGSTVLPVSEPLPSLFYAIATEDSGTHTEEVLVANAKGSAVDLSLRSTGLCGSCKAVLSSWTSSSARPVLHPLSGGLPGVWAVPSDSVDLIHIDGLSGISHPPPNGNTTGTANGSVVPSDLRCPGTVGVTCSSTTLSHAISQAERLIMRGEA